MRRRRPLVKICGVTRPEDARLAAELGVDLLGLNFYEPSPRFVEPARAAEIAREVAGRLILVGVFVNRPAVEIEAIAGTVGLDLVQLHGDEPAAEVRRFGPRAIKALRLPGDGGRVDLEPFAEAWGFVIEARHEDLYGGTGRSWDYERVARVETSRPVLVAGGIGPGNARRALDLSAAAGIDACSGVESAPGVKDPAALRALLAALRDDSHHRSRPAPAE